MAALTLAVWDLCHERVTARINNLAIPGPLPGSPPLACKKVMLAGVSEKQLGGPVLLAALDGLKASAPRGVAAGQPGLVEVVYPVAVYFVQRGEAGSDPLYLPYYQGVMSRVMNAFQWQGIDVRSVWQVRPVPLEQIDRELPHYQSLRSGVVLNCYSWQPVTGVPA